MRILPRLLVSFFCCVIIVTLVQAETPQGSEFGEVVKADIDKVRFRFAAFSSTAPSPSLTSSRSAPALENTLSVHHKDNIKSYVDVEKLTTFKNQQDRDNYLEEQCRSALQAFGYYQADCQVTVHLAELLPQRQAKRVDIDYRIDLRAPVRVREANIRIVGDAKDSLQFTELLAEYAPKKGSPFQHGTYEILKQELQETAYERGYFDADFLVQRVQIYIDALAADITLELDSGPRYRFGVVSIEGGAVDTALIEPLFTFKEGDYYTAEAMIKLNSDLLQTHYFSQVRVLPLLDQLSHARVPVNVQLRMKPKNTVRFGIGYSTDVKTRLRAGWIKPWINSRGRSLSMQSEISSVHQSVDARFQTPVLGKLDHEYTQGLTWERDEVERRKTISLTLGYTFPLTNRQSLLARSSRWVLAPFVRIDNEKFTELGLQEEATSLIPGFEIRRRRKRGGLNPYWGDYLRLGYETGLKVLASEQNFHQLTISGKLIRSYFHQDSHDHSGFRLLAAMNLGAIFNGGPVSEIPDSFRFRAGGDQSVRGFAYKSIGPESTRVIGGVSSVEIDVEGAQKLAVISLEVDRAVAEKWRAAFFVDGGDAFDDQFDWNVGTGFGLRWLSPVGPIKMDWAFAVSETSSPFRIHFSMGLDL